MARNDDPATGSEHPRDLFQHHVDIDALVLPARELEHHAGAEEVNGVGSERLRNPRGEDPTDHFDSVA